MKKFAAIQTDQSGAFTSMSKQKWNLCKWDAKGERWDCLENPNFGFKKMLLNLAPHRFIQAQSINTLEKEIKEREFIASYGTKKKDSFDYACPSCGWHFEAPDHISDNFYNTFRKEAFVKVDCICGCNFRAEIEYIVTAKTEIKKL